MTIGIVVIILILAVAALLLIAYPLWQQSRLEAWLKPNQAGQTLEEYEVQYQATLSSIKDLMFDYEMGKVSGEDYEALLDIAKAEAAEIRRKIDQLNSRVEAVEISAGLDSEIELQVTRTRSTRPAVKKRLLRKIDAEIELLKGAAPTPATAGKPACSCGQPFQAGDAFCSGCGQSLGQISGADEAQTPCQNCGALVQPGDAFCAACGAALDPMPESATQDTAT